MSALAAMSLSQTAIAADPILDANVDNPAGTTITGTAGYGVKLDAGGPYTIANSGEITVDAATEGYGIWINDNGDNDSLVVTSLINNGVIYGEATATKNGYGIVIHDYGTITTLTNSGTIHGF